MSAEYRDTGDELRARLRQLDSERVRLTNAIKAYDVATGTEVELKTLAGLDLNDMTVKDAVVKLLAYAWNRGKQSMTAGEIEATLRNFRVRTTRSKKPASEAKSLWLILVRVLTAPGNAAYFKLEQAGDNRRLDRVSLAKPPEGKAL